MDWTNQNIAADLKWFYQSAPGECGIRSTQSGFEAQMEARALTGLECGMHVRETRSSAYHDPVDDRRLDAWRRARAIHERLATLTEHARRVLEAQYGCVHVVGDVSLSLACMQPSAREGHVAAVHAARVRLERKQADMQRRALIGHRERHPALKPKRRLTGGSTPRDFVLFLCTSPETAELLETILSEARAELAEVMRAYGLARPGEKQVQTISDPDVSKLVRVAGEYPEARWSPPKRTVPDLVGLLSLSGYREQEK